MLEKAGDRLVVVQFYQVKWHRDVTVELTCAEKPRCCDVRSLLPRFVTV